MSVDELELRLAWQRHVGEVHALDPLLDRYREAHRRYHGLRHLTWVVRHVQDLARTEPSEDLGAVVAAAFFHDAVYRGRPDDEAASARLARRSLEAIGWTPGRAERVARLVHRTAGHLAELPSGAPAHERTDAPAHERTDAPPRERTDAPEDHTGFETDAAILLDADLAILGADPASYLDYVRGVRAEHADLDESAWRAGRTAAVRRLAAPEHRYRTGTARTRWEARARANLAAELSTLVVPDAAP